MPVMELLMLMALCMVSGVSAQQHRPYYQNDYPDSLNQQARCGRHTQKIYVCDPHSVLGTQDTEASQLDQDIVKIINETTCPCSAFSCERHRGGYKIGIALVERMHYRDNRSSIDEDHDEREARVRKLKKTLDEAAGYAHEIREKWKLGHCDEDVLIFYSVADNVVYTATGDVARQKLTNELVVEISKDARRIPAVHSPFERLQTILKEYKAVFQGIYHLRQPKAAPQVGSGVLPMGSQISVVMMVLALLGIYGIM